MEEFICHICGKITEPEFICARCGEHVCEDCMVHGDSMTLIEECRCSFCHNSILLKAKIDALKEEEYKKEIEAKKAKKREDAKRRYNSPEAKEKRRIKKELKLKKRREDQERLLKELAETLKNWVS